MQVLTVRSESDLSKLDKNLPLIKKGCVVALGFFDGIHLAHRALIESAKKEAKKLNLPLTVFTFSQNNTSFKAEQPRLLTEEEKLSELSALGVDVSFVFDFDLIKDISADAFVEQILVTRLNTHTAFCGFNFKFGKNAGGDCATLQEEMKRLGRRAVVIDEYKERGTSLSSSVIRSLILDKKLREASRLLGKPFFLDGKVTHGLGLGKKLGIPTVNIPLKQEKLSLARGVYFTVTDVSGTLYPGITNVGTCPTFDEREVHTETFIFDFNDDLYNADIRIYFIDFLREEIKFSSKEELIMQINVDKARALTLKKEIKWLEIGLNLQ